MKTTKTTKTTTAALLTAPTLTTRTVKARRLKEADAIDSANVAESIPVATIVPGGNYDAVAPVAGPTYVVVKGDTLSKIAKSHLGAANAYKALWSANRAVIGDNPDLIYPGQVLTIPVVVQ